ncbi:MAG: phospholipase D-like domain-containing protein [Acidimicrobiales bacterium]
MRRFRLTVWSAAVLMLIGFVATPAAASAISTVPVTGVWVEPSAGLGFLDAAITQARSSIDMSMYELSDATVESDLVAAVHRHVRVRVLLDAAYAGRYANASAVATLRAGGATVAWAPGGQIFHAKYVVIDRARAYVGTGNLTSRWYSSTRDVWVEITAHPRVVAIEAVFARDITGHPGRPASTGGLVWSPGSTSSLVSLIDTAHRSLLIENEEMKSYTIEDALAAAAHRGVAVTVVMTASSEWASALSELTHAGVHVHTISPQGLYIHAKVICVDCAGPRGTAFVGSENFSYSSLTYNRELGVITTSPAVVEAVERAVSADARR